MATLLPNGKQQFFDAAGNPLVGGKVYFYIPGTTTPKDTYQDSGASILNTNPITLDAAGEAVIYGSGAYRQIVQDALGNTIWDQITSDTSAAQNSWAVTSGGTPNAQTVTATTFTSADGQQISFRAGATNTGALTLNVNGAGPIAVRKDGNAGPVALTGGEVYAGNVYTVTYDTTLGCFHLLSTPQATIPTYGTMAPLNIATAAEFRGNSAERGLATNEVWSAADTVTLTDGATVTLDLSTGINFKVTLAGNRTLAVSNAKKGQSGAIEVYQDATGSRTLSYTAGSFVFVNGSAITLSTAANTRDLISYKVLSDGKVLLNAGKAVA